MVRYRARERCNWIKKECHRLFNVRKKSMEVFLCAYRFRSHGLIKNVRTVRIRGLKRERVLNSFGTVWCIFGQIFRSEAFIKFDGKWFSWEICERLRKIPFELSPVLITKRNLRIFQRFNAPRKVLNTLRDKLTKAMRITISQTEYLLIVSVAHVSLFQNNRYTNWSRYINTIIARNNR